MESVSLMMNVPTNWHVLTEYVRIHAKPHIYLVAMRLSVVLLLTDQFVCALRDGLEILMKSVINVCIFSWNTNFAQIIIFFFL